MTLKEMREYLGNGDPISKASFSRKFKIPIRTLENWESGKRVPPEYVLFLLEKVVLLERD